MPQIILTGGILPLDSEPLCTIAKIAAPAYWAFRAIRTGETELPEGFPWHMDYDDSIGLACGACSPRCSAASNQVGVRYRITSRDN